MGEVTCIEICAGAGGQALGLEQAGFTHLAAVEWDGDACATLRMNRPQWDVLEQDVRDYSGTPHQGRVDLIAGGVPCPPFSIAGQQLGAADERDLFPAALRIVAESDPKAVMLENVRGLATAKFAPYRRWIIDTLEELGYVVEWQLLNSSEFGVAQLRPRFILVALKPEHHAHFTWPMPVGTPPTVGEVLRHEMARDGWPGASRWVAGANGIGPTLVGGSKKHGGPDLGPTRARAGWAQLGVNGKGVADAPPTATDPADLNPKLTVRMAALIQGFPPEWKFAGRKTAAYRQVGNAFPPPVARAVGLQIRQAITADQSSQPVRATQLRLVS